MSREANRRRFLYGTGALIATGALAGCSGNGNGNGDVPQEIDDHLDGANEYDGSMDDQTGEDEVTVEVGAGDGLAFSPAAVRVDVDATVVWEWTGNGGQHNVNSVDGSDYDFQSDLMEDEGETFEQTFDEAGNALYECEPHSANGMLGGVEVVE